MSTLHASLRKDPLYKESLRLLLMKKDVRGLYMIVTQVDSTRGASFLVNSLKCSGFTGAIPYGDAAAVHINDKALDIIAREIDDYFEGFEEFWFANELKDDFQVFESDLSHMFDYLDSPAKADIVLLQQFESWMLCYSIVCGIFWFTKNGVITVSTGE